MAAGLCAGWWRERDLCGLLSGFVMVVDLLVSETIASVIDYCESVLVASMGENCILVSSKNLEEIIMQHAGHLVK